MMQDRELSDPGTDAPTVDDSPAETSIIYNRGLWGTLRIPLIVGGIVLLIGTRSFFSIKSNQEQGWDQIQAFQEENVLYNAFCKESNTLMYVRENETRFDLVVLNLTTNSIRLVEEIANLTFRKQPILSDVSDYTSSCSIFSLGGYADDGTIEASMDLISVSGLDREDLEVKVTRPDVTSIESFHSVTAVSFGDLVFLFGGMSDKKNLTAFNTSTFEFYEIEVNGTDFEAVQSRCKQSATEYNGKIYIQGGYDCNKNYILHPSLYSFDPSTNEFSTILSEADFDDSSLETKGLELYLKRHSATLLINNGNIFIHGGIRNYRHYLKEIIVTQKKEEAGRARIECEKNGEKSLICLYDSVEYLDERTEPISVTGPKLSTAFISEDTLYVHTMDGDKYHESFSKTALISLSTDTITDHMRVPSFTRDYSLLKEVLPDLLLLPVPLLFVIMFLIYRIMDKRASSAENSPPRGHYPED